MYYIQSSRRLIQAAKITEDSELLFKKAKFDKSIKQNISQYTTHQAIGPYTFCTCSPLGKTNAFVYQGNVCLAYLECHPYQLSAGNAAQYTVDCLIVDFVWINNPAVNSTSILYELLSAGSLFSNRFTAILSNHRITSSTFNAYYEFLQQYITTFHSYIYDNTLGVVVRLPAARYWYVFSSPNTLIDKSTQLLICKKSQGARLAMMGLQQYIAYRAALKKHRNSKSSGNKQLKIFTAVPNSALSQQDWMAVPQYVAGPIQIAGNNPNIQPASASQYAIDPASLKQFFIQMRYKPVPLDAKAAAQLQSMIGQFQIVPGSFRCMKAYKRNNKAYSLLFIAVPDVKNQRMSLIRIFLDK